MTEQVDQYKILKSLGKGGMGEVFLAYDPLCQRKIALKQILPSLKGHKVIRERFLREAKIASRLTHPSIIPIFSIDPGEQKEYYTMPYIEGETLKQILKTSLEEEKRGEVVHSSIPSLVRLFLSVCEAIAYAHSQGVIHRDLKPDNIIVGKYGQVMLLDWGLADWMGEKSKEEGDEEETPPDLTRHGKVPGTLNYLAPERILQGKSEPSLDIYALGVILYQLLTLRAPFQRDSLKEYKKRAHLEELIDPAERSPYRDIPQQLSDIAKRALRFDPKERFASVDEMVEEIRNFIEGRPEWRLSCTLNPLQPTDWAFQENLLLPQQRALTRSFEGAKWVNLMLSRVDFHGNVRLEARFRLGEGTRGIGFLFGMNVPRGGSFFGEGFCLLIADKSALFHNFVEVMTLPSVSIGDQQWHLLRLERMGQELFIYVDGDLKGHYVSRTPFSTSHVGLLFYDADFTLEPLHVSISSQNVLIDCLCVPDALFNYKEYDKARLEYEKIASSFPGRWEGREALFRSALTLIEEAKGASSFEERELFGLRALTEFGKLRDTPGAPLEYLGKSLVYKASSEVDEEIKCLELGLRKYKAHPLVSSLKEQILMRLYETASKERSSAYQFALLALRFLPEVLLSAPHEALLTSLKSTIRSTPLFSEGGEEKERLICDLALLLGRPIPLVEVIESSHSPSLVVGALLGLLLLGQVEWAMENLDAAGKEKAVVKRALEYFEKGPSAVLEGKGFPSLPFAYFVLHQALVEGKTQGLLPYFKSLPPSPSLDALHVLYCVKEKKWEVAEKVMSSYSPESLCVESSPLFFPVGVMLLRQGKKREALSHLSHFPLFVEVALGKRDPASLEREIPLFFERMEAQVALTVF